MTPKLRSGVRKRSVRIGIYKTGPSVEDKFWQGLKEIAHKRGLPLNALLGDINQQRAHANLSSVIRLYVLEHYRRLASGAAPGGSGKVQRDAAR